MNRKEREVILNSKHLIEILCCYLPRALRDYRFAWNNYWTTAFNGNKYVKEHYALIYKRKAVNKTNISSYCTLHRAQSLLLVPITELSQHRIFVSRKVSHIQQTVQRTYITLKIHPLSTPSKIPIFGFLFGNLFQSTIDSQLRFSIIPFKQRVASEDPCLILLDHNMSIKWRGDTNWRGIRISQSKEISVLNFTWIRVWNELKCCATSLGAINEPPMDNQPRKTDKLQSIQITMNMDLSMWHFPCLLYCPCAELSAVMGEPPIHYFVSHDCYPCC